MIVGVSMVKNAADIIESMVRANAEIVDQFVIYDHMSTDRTVEILQLLKNEGYAIEILCGTDIAYNQKDKTNALIYYAKEHHHPEFIIPIDDDEVVLGSRKEIYKLQQDSLYYMKWKIYLPTEEDDLSDDCVIRRQKYCYSDEVEVGTKVIIPVGVLGESSDFQIAMGNHFGEGKLIQSHVLLPNFRMAHFPCRSEEQIRSKVLIGWTNILALPEKEKDWAKQWEIMSQIIKEGKPIPIDMLQMMTLLYLDKPSEEQMHIVYQPLELRERCFELKYTGGSEVNAMKNFCIHVEQMATEISRIKK